MMDYEMFKEIVKKKIKDYMPPEYRDATVDIFSVNKVNGAKDALAIRKAEEQIAPNLYLDNYYKMYQGYDDLKKTLEVMAEEVRKETGIRFVPDEGSCSNDACEYGAEQGNACGYAPQGISGFIRDLPLCGITE